MGRLRIVNCTGGRGGQNLNLWLSGYTSEDRADKSRIVA